MIRKKSKSPVTAAAAIAYHQIASAHHHYHHHHLLIIESATLDSMLDSMLGQDLLRSDIGDNPSLQRANNSQVINSLLKCLISETEGKMNKQEMEKKEKKEKKKMVDLW